MCGAGVKRMALAGAVVVLACVTAQGLDWPTYLGDATRSATTQEQLAFPLNEVWVHRARHAPAPAWPPPAKTDFWHDLRDLRPTVTFDRAFHTVIAGDAVYFGSSADDQVYCLDAATGETRWRFFTEGPVRLAPEVVGDKVYVGSDDGWVYCLSATDGALLWRYAADPEVLRIPGNGRIISPTPVRTGVLVRDGIAHFCAGIFPGQRVYRCALNAEDGAPVWRRRTGDLSPQGYLLASADRLFVPTGRTTPVMFDLASGDRLGELGGRGGAYAVVVSDVVVTGPGRTSGGIDMADLHTRESIVQFDGLRMIVHHGVAYMQSKRELSALDHGRHTELARERHALIKRRRAHEEELKELAKDSPEALDATAEIAALTKQADDLTRAMAACYLWKRPCWAPFSMILSGDALITGGDGEVAAVRAADGAKLWSGQVTGKAYGLAVANGALLVSTDLGTIHCFRQADIEREHVAAPRSDPTPFPEDRLTPVYAAAADYIVAQRWPKDGGGAPKRGYCLVLECGEGRLAWELARRTDLRIVGIESDPGKVQAAREALDAAGLYGARVSVHHVPRDRMGAGDLPYTSLMANLVVCDATVASGELPVPADEVTRLLRPFGGMALIGQPGDDVRRRDRLSKKRALGWTAGSSAGWTVDAGAGAWARLERGALPGSGEWTQLYADASHTACSNDPLEGPMRIQWFGEPGPREMIDRHHRPMSSLFKGGRSFIPANDRVITIDAYNGTPLWELSVPNSRRVAALRNCGHMLVTDDLLYVAVEGECWAVDVATGAPRFTLEAPQLRGEQSDWGYLNRLGDRLYGSGMKAGASVRNFSRDTVTNLIENDFRPMIASNYLFSMDRYSGHVAWTYENGVVMNNGITLGGGRIYFVESKSRLALRNADGRLRVDWFCESDTRVVALNAKTGRKAWARPFQLPFEQIMFLSFADGVLLATGTDNVGDKVQYDLFAFDASSGVPLWHSTCQNSDPIGGSHGEQWQHPVIIGDRVFSDPFAFDLHTGERLDYLLDRGGHGCGGLTGSLHYMYGRGGNPRMYTVDATETTGTRLTHVSRPGCWLNIIPAGGIVVLPESSSGCTCAYPIQTSFGFIPENLLPAE